MRFLVDPLRIDQSKEAWKQVSGHCFSFSPLGETNEYAMRYSIYLNTDFPCKIEGLKTVDQYISATFPITTMFSVQKHYGQAVNNTKQHSKPEHNNLI